MSSSSNNNNNNTNKDAKKQFHMLRSKANLDRERRKESEYKTMFLELLQQNRSLLSQNMDSKDVSSLQDYKKEQEILKKLMNIEREAIMGAVVLGISAFATVRYFPRIGTRLIGGKAKYEAMKAAEAEAYKISPQGHLFKSLFSTAIEASFGFWAAYKGFNIMVDRQAKGDSTIQEDISNLPLVEGRSLICDNLCDEWTKLIHWSVSKDFWKAVEEDTGSGEGGEDNRIKTSSPLDEQRKIKNVDFWKAVRQFGNTCIKRRRYEELLRKKHGIKQANDAENVNVDSPAYPSIPSPGVPDNIMELTDEEVIAIVNDR